MTRSIMQRLRVRKREYKTPNLRVTEFCTIQQGDRNTTRENLQKKDALSEDAFRTEIPLDYKRAAVIEHDEHRLSSLFYGHTQVGRGRTLLLYAFDARSMKGRPFQ